MTRHKSLNRLDLFSVQLGASQSSNAPPPSPKIPMAPPSTPVGLSSLPCVSLPLSLPQTSARRIRSTKHAYHTVLAGRTPRPKGSRPRGLSAIRLDEEVYQDDFEVDAMTPTSAPRLNRAQTGIGTCATTF